LTKLINQNDQSNAHSYCSKVFKKLSCPKAKKKSIDIKKNVRKYRKNEVDNG